MPLLRLVYWIEDYLPGVLLAVMTGLVIVDVTGRYVLGATFAGAAEIATALFVWLVFLGSSGAVRKLQHIGIAGLSELLPPRALIVLQLLISAAIFLACLHVARISFHLSNASWGREIDMVGVPYFYVYIIIPVSFVLMAFHCAAQILDILRNGDKSKLVATRATTDAEI
jgi:TRAP-type C4-dicarboxylate transport system permease small subunit